MGWLANLFRKQSQVRTVLAMESQGRTVGPPREYETYAKEGYALNVIAHRCITLISRGVGRIPLCLYRDTKKEPEEVKKHPFLDVMRRPNPLASWPQLSESGMSYLLISGNSYIELVPKVKDSTSAPIGEMWSHGPDRFKIIPGANGIPSKYEMRSGQNKIDFTVDALGRSNILHMKTFNPTDIWYGQAPLLTAAYDIDQLNEQNKWNYSLLKRSARPSLAFVVKKGEGQSGNLMPNQREQLKTDIDELWSGSTNAGRPIVLEGGMDVKELSLSPKDMEFQSTKRFSQKDVALVFGVPEELVGNGEAKTFSNYEQARMALYQDTIIPWAEFWAAYLNTFVLPRFGDDKVYLAPDRDRIEALSPERDKRWERAATAEHLTYNERRTIVDFGRYENDEKLKNRDPGDVLFIPAGMTPLEVAAAPALNGGIDDGDYVDPNADPSADPAAAEDQADESGAQKSKGKKPTLHLIDLPSKDAKVRAAKLLDEIRKRHEHKVGQELFTLFMRQKHELKAAFYKKVDATLVSFIVTQILEQSQAKLAETLRAGMRACADEIGRPMLKRGKSIDGSSKDAESVWESAMDRYINTEVAEKVTRVQGTTHKRVVKSIREAMSENQEEGDSIAVLADAIEERFESMSAARAATIARTETHNASMFSTSRAAEALQLPNMTKEWVPIGDNRTRDYHADMEGQEVELHEKFQVPSPDGAADEMDRPGDSTAPANQVINCRCALVFSTGAGEQEED